VRSDPPRFRWNDTGTRFLLYPQSRVVPGFAMPRVVCLPSRAGTIRPGPEDRRIYVVDAIRKRPYRDPATGVYDWRPPYPPSLPRERPVRPSPQGQFDYLKPGTRTFSAAAAYA